MNERTTPELLSLMHTGTRAEIKAANAEYWGRVESGAHVRPAPVAVLGAGESPAEFTRRSLSAL